MTYDLSRPARLTGAIITLILLAGATVLLLAPIDPNAPPLPVSDKVVHAALFLCLALPPLLARLIPDRVVVLGLVGYGLAVEILQPSFGRSFDLFDMLANMIGIALAVGLVVAWRTWRKPVLLTKNL
jgi:VanZ family protein